MAGVRVATPCRPALRERPVHIPLLDLQTQYASTRNAGEELAA